LARGKGIVPHFLYPSLWEVDLEKLKELGIKAILLDLDNTWLSVAETKFPKR